MSMSALLQAMTALPQVIETVKKMNEDDKRRFVSQLGLEGEELETAIAMITCFQEGKSLTPEQQRAAQPLLEKALFMNNLDLKHIFSPGNI